MYRREKSWYMRFPNLDFSTLLYMPFSFYEFSLINCSGIKEQEHDVYDIVVITPFEVGQFIALHGLGQSWAPE